MDISQLKSMNLSLSDYLSGGKAADTAYNLLAASMNTAMPSSQDSAAGVQVTLSEEAQKLLAEGADTPTNKISGVQKGAQNFLMAFFDQSGISFDKLSNEAKSLILGLQDVVESSDATARDVSTDNAEMKYADGSKKVYTLTGANTRLRLAVEYGSDGKPTKLSVTDITGGRVETADIILQKDNDGAATMLINRTQREYSNGHMTNLVTSDPLEVGLYQSSAA